ncbi:prepilin peptidase [Colwellia psychrerythraea]|uniref:Peptidase A24A prepilin type IV n=1 Tax=Colwellia psychrerythraea TaxID=28229 RepID=A0A099KLU4_COLPS|nr:prepilin peptidase [Colwellia psychrerythraea]KGJ91195.1 peptidase A24A prepilin type IV [Colwellia psychrerythraea]
MFTITVIITCLHYLVAGLLVKASYLDWRYRQLPNWLSLLVLVSGMSVLLLQQLLVSAQFYDFSLRMITAFLIIVAALPVYYLGGLAAGDIKFIAALSVWFEFEQLKIFLLLTTLVGGLLALIIIGYNVSLNLFNSRDKGNKTTIITVPYGIAISLGAAFVLI